MKWPNDPVEVTEPLRKNPLEIKDPVALPVGWAEWDMTLPVPWILSCVISNPLVKAPLICEAIGIELLIIPLGKASDTPVTCEASVTSIDPKTSNLPNEPVV